MVNISVAQAVYIWDDLTTALNGTNGFGGHTAEIYAYRLMPYSPSFAQDPQSEICREVHEQLVHNAGQSLLELLRLFQQKHRCDITIDDKPFNRYDHSWEGFSHRVHVEIHPVPKLL